MPLVNFAAGSRILASQLNMIQPIQVIKPTDQSVTSSSTLVNDTALLLPVVASATYEFRCYLNYEGGVNGSSDIKWTWTLPASATLRYTYQTRNTSNAVDSGITNTGGTTGTAGSNGAGTLRGVSMTGTLIGASAPGNLQLQWAQNTISGTATIVHAQSSLTLLRVS